MTVQTLDKASESIDKYLKLHPEAKLATIYKYIRSRTDISLFGDDPIINEIVFRAYHAGKIFSKRDVVKTFKLTEDPVLQSQRIDSQMVRSLTCKEEIESALGLESNDQ